MVVSCGCAQSSPTSVHDVKAAALQPRRIEPQLIDGTPGVRVTLPHYVIYSTISDQQVIKRIGQVLEGAWDQYRSLAPQIPASLRPMECYFFETRSQWAAYTKAHTGDDAAIYLRVNRGGYTVNDKFVAYWIGDIGTSSVAAHEGWHQYVARHLKGRLPPFLEEGLACMFEQVQWVEPGKNMPALPQFDLTRNHPRLSALRASVDEDEMYPLKTLVTMHAGQVVGKRSAKIEAFYAECWAFARFMNESHPLALKSMLSDASRGTLFADSSTDDASNGPLWDPATAKPMLEHYLGKNLADIEAEFAKYVKSAVE
jgi:hypothetical protein